MLWDITKAEEFCAGVTDGTHDSPKAVNEGHYLITSKHLSEYEIDFSTAKQISEEDYQKIIKRSAVGQWDILFSMIGTIGNTYLEKNECVDYACKNMGIFQMGGDKEKALWLYFYLKSPQAKEYVFSHLRGSTQQYLPLGGLRDFPIPVPKKNIREKIVSVLKVIDDKIENNNLINRNLSEQARSVYMETFGKFEKTKVLEDYPVKIYSGGTPSTSKKEYWEGGDIHWLSSGETANEFVTTTDKTITQLGVDNSSTKWASKYDVVTASAGQGHTRGQTTMILLNTCINQSVIVTHAAKEYMPFIFFNLSGRYEELRVLSDGTSTRGSLTTKIMAKLKMPDVTENTIIKFSDYAWSAISQIEVNLKENEKLACLRDSLLLKLMTGEIDVSDLNI